MMFTTFKRYITLHLQIIGWIFCLVFLSGESIAQSVDAIPALKPSSSIISIEGIKLKLEELELDADIDQINQDTLGKLYRKAISDLQSALANEQTTLKFVQSEKNAPLEASALRQNTIDKKKISPESTLLNYAHYSLVKLEPLLLKEKANLAAVEAKLTKAREALKYHTERPQAIRQQLIATTRKADGIASELQKPTIVADELPAVTQARQWAREAAAIKLGAEIRMFDQELLSHPFRIKLYTAELEKAEHSLSFVKARVVHLEQLVNDRRQVKASQVQVEAEQSQLQVQGQPLIIQQLAKSNIELSRNINEITNDLKQIADEEVQAREWSARINQDYKRTKQKLDIAGMSKLLGRVLREQSRSLPDTRLYKKSSKLLEDKIADVSLAQLGYREELEKLRNLNVYIEQYFADVSPKEKQELEEVVRNLASDRVVYLSQLVSIQNTYIREMSELDFSQNKLMEIADTYDKYLDEHLLWIRSSVPISFLNFTAIPGQIEEFLSYKNWFDVIDTLWRQASNNFYMLLTLIVVGILLWKERVMRAALHATGKFIGKPTKDSILHTLQALTWTLMLAMAWPVLLLSTGLQLHEDISPSAFTRAVSESLILLSIALFVLLAFAIYCETDGVADRHFRWPRTSLVVLRSNIDILIYTFLPLGFICIIVINSNISDQGVGLGRLVFVLMMFIITLFFYRVLNPSRGVLRTLYARQKKTTMIGIRYGWLSLAVLLPTACALLAMAGYLYTAGILATSFVETLWLLLELITFQQFIVRWLLVIRGRLALQAAREKREAARQVWLAQQEQSSPVNEFVQDAKEPEIDIDALSDDSMKLLNLTAMLIGALGIWGIWSEVLPALSIFNQITLYQHAVNIAGEISYQAVTLGDVGQSILILVVLALLLRRLPALLEILLRQGTAISSGGLYTVKTLTRYTVVALGVVLIFRIFGGAWSDIQWVFAALGVGIGFGLQEIVANFISGLIILFERPIRVGDMVTVGEISGTVTKIQIRATTIRDWDRKELLVPNKEFITGRLLNWSLSDTISRLLLPVGVAYGSDVPLAMKLMLEATKENDMIIDDPAPLITFDSFSDNALTLTARVYIDDLDNRIHAISALHSAINEKFGEAGIVIAFPQRDVHLDTSKPLEVRINKDKQNEDQAPDTVTK